MARIAVPVGETNVRSYFGALAPEIWEAKERFHDAVYRHSRLSLREFEAARMRIGVINGCLACQATRAGRDRPKPEWSEELPEEFYAAVVNWPPAEALSAREQLAVELANRLALDHLSLDDDEEFWARLHDRFSDEELVDLALAIASGLAGGRISHAFGIDVCDVHGGPLPTSTAE